MRRFKNPENDNQFRVKPAHTWSSDTKDFFLNGAGGYNRSAGIATVDFRRLKEHLFYFALEQKENNITLSIKGEAKILLSEVS